MNVRPVLSRVTRPTGPQFSVAFVFILLALILCAAGSAQAATYTWDGGGTNNNVTTAQNWVGDILPTADSDIVWAGTTRLTVNVDSGGPQRSILFNNTAGAFVIGGAAFSVSNGLINNSTNLQTLTMAVTLTAAQSIAATAGNFSFTGSTFGNGGFVLTADGAHNISISNVISGAGGLTKTGAGTLTLSGINTYTGNNTINGGTVIVNRASSLGTGGLTINAGTLEIATGFSTTRAITLGNAASTFQVDPSQTFTTTGVISGSGTLNKTGTGTMTLSGVNTYTGATNISAGTLQISASDRIANTSDLTVSGGTFGLQTFNDTVGNVTLSSGSITGTGTLTGTSYAVQSGTASPNLAGNGATMTKTTAGTVTLTGANTFTGATTVSGGTLTLATGSGSALGLTSGITVNSGGTLLLGASNQINNTAPMTLAGGTFAKGDFSEGSMSTAGAGALTLSANGSNLDFGTGTVGTVTFASFTPGAFVLAIDNWTGAANTVGNAATDRLIFDVSQSSNLNSFAFTGFASGATEFDLGNGYYEVTPLSAVPEPSTYVAAALALGALAYHWLRRCAGIGPEGGSRRGRPISFPRFSNRGHPRR